MATKEIKVNAEVLVANAKALKEMLDPMENKLSDCVVGGKSKLITEIISAKEQISNYLDESILNEGYYIAESVEVTTAILTETDQNIGKEMES